MIRVIDTGIIPIIGMDGETIEIMGAVITCTEEAEVRTLGPIVYEEVAVLRASELDELRAENERLKGQVAVLTGELGAALAKADQTAADAHRAALGGAR